MGGRQVYHLPGVFEGSASMPLLHPRSTEKSRTYYVRSTEYATKRSRCTTYIHATHPAQPSIWELPGKRHLLLQMLKALFYAHSSPAVSDSAVRVLVHTNRAVS